MPPSVHPSDQLPAPSRHAYRFTFHAGVPAKPPVTDLTRVLDKAFEDEPLSREEKDQIAEVLHGLFGSGRSEYKLQGWAWPMHAAKQMQRILVNTQHCGWEEFYAPDKTSLRKALVSRGGGRIIEMTTQGQTAGQVRPDRQKEVADEKVVLAIQDAAYVAMEIQMQLVHFAATPKGRKLQPPLNLQMPTVDKNEGGVVEWRFFCADAGRFLAEEYKQNVAASENFDEGMWPTLVTQFAASVVDHIVTERTLIPEDGLREMVKAAIRDQVGEKEAPSQASQQEAARQLRGKCVLVFVDELKKAFPSSDLKLEPNWDNNPDRPEPAYDLILPIEDDGSITQYGHGRMQHEVSQWHTLATPLPAPEAAKFLTTLGLDLRHERVAPMSKETQTNRARDRVASAGPQNPYALGGDGAATSGIGL